MDPPPLQLHVPGGVGEMIGSEGWNVGTEEMRFGDQGMECWPRRGGMLNVRERMSDCREGMS